MKTKKLYFGTNLKMYKTIRMTVDYLQQLEELTKDISRDEIELFVLPSYTSLESAVKSTEKRVVRLGAQNMNWEDEGQFTGDISPVMLKELNLDLVMIGHSERRHVFRETDTEENQKVKAALKHGFTALLCVGETAEDKAYGVSAEVLRTQLKIGFSGVEREKIPSLRVAYEPVWSIGVNGTPATADYAEKMHKEIKSVLAEIFGEDGRTIPVLYGGSVNPGNACQLITRKYVDGLYVGRAAWEASAFDRLIRESMEAYKNQASK